MAESANRNAVHTRVAWHCTCFNMRRAARAVTRIYDEALAESGLKATQFTTLGAVAILGPAPLTHLAERMELDRTTLTRNLRILADRGLVGMTAGDDRRERVVAVTGAGTAALAAATPAWRRAQEQVAAGLGEERLRRLVDDLDDLAAVASAAATE